MLICHIQRTSMPNGRPLNKGGREVKWKKVEKLEVFWKTMGVFHWGRGSVYLGKWCPMRPATWVELNWKLFLGRRMTLVRQERFEWEMSSVLDWMRKWRAILHFLVPVFLPKCTKVKSEFFFCQIIKFFECLKEHPLSETRPRKCTSNFRLSEYKQFSFRGHCGVLATVPHAAAPASGCLVGCGGQSSSTPRGVTCGEGKVGLVGLVGLGGWAPLAN